MTGQSKATMPDEGTEVADDGFEDRADDEDDEEADEVLFDDEEGDDEEGDDVDVDVEGGVEKMVDCD
jgi:hypothetical protein